MGRQKGSALGLAEMNSDGKPCSGVRGDHEVSTEFFEKTKGLVCENFGRTLLWEPFSRFFHSVCKKKKSQMRLRFFVFTSIFLFCGFFFVCCGCGIKGMVSPQHIGKLDKCLFLLVQRAPQAFLNMQKQGLDICTQSLRFFCKHG